MMMVRNNNFDLMFSYTKHHFLLMPHHVD
jgi:hypothetical protein